MLISIHPIVEYVSGVDKDSSLSRDSEMVCFKDKKVSTMSSLIFEVCQSVEM